jgi:hypothetical protein
MLTSTATWEAGTRPRRFAATIVVRPIVLIRLLRSELNPAPSILNQDASRAFKIVKATA